MRVDTITFSEVGEPTLGRDEDRTAAANHGSLGFTIC